jgi:hypothetical protein
MRSEQLNGAISKVEDEHVNRAQSEATSPGTNDKHLALDIQAACPEVPCSRRPLPRKIQSHVDVEKLNGNCITSSPLQDCSEVINAVPVVSSARTSVNEACCALSLASEIKRKFFFLNDSEMDAPTNFFWPGQLTKLGLAGAANPPNHLGPN